MLLIVPVIHHGEREGAYVISVGRSDPYFKDLRKLWKARYPEKINPPSSEVDGLQIIADFATHFAAFCR